MWLLTNAFVEVGAGLVVSVVALALLLRKPSSASGAVGPGSKAPAPPRGETRPAAADAPIGGAPGIGATEPDGVSGPWGVPATPPSPAVPAADDDVTPAPAERVAALEFSALAGADEPLRDVAAAPETVPWPEPPVHPAAPSVVEARRWPPEPPTTPPVPSVEPPAATPFFQAVDPEATATVPESEAPDGAHETAVDGAAPPAEGALRRAPDSAPGSGEQAPSRDARRTAGAGASKTLTPYDADLAQWLAMTVEGLDANRLLSVNYINRQAQANRGPEPLRVKQMEATIRSLERLAPASVFSRNGAREDLHDLLSKSTPELRLIWPESGDPFDPERHDGKGDGAVASMIRPGLERPDEGRVILKAQVTRSASNQPGSAS